MSAPALLLIVGTLASVWDGDTLRVAVDGASIPVRLEGIAAPEVRPLEPGGIEARDYLRQWLGRGIVCEGSGTSYNRVVATCWVDGKDLGRSVVAAGLARDCPAFSGGRYAEDETEAGRALVLPSYCEVP